jgi:hypothetical protein
MQRVVETPAPLSEDRIAEAIASKVVAIVRDELGWARDEEWIDAKEVARRFGLSRSWVYEHSGLLGARRAGTGKRPRLRFEPSVVAAALRDAQAAAEREPDLGDLEIHVPRVRSK